MNTVVQELLNSFDQLTDSERQEFAAEILKRIVHLDSQPLSDDDLALNAEELFVELDKQESANE